LTVPLSDHQARSALSKNPIDYNNARQGFLDGRVHPADIDGVIWLFSTFNRIYYINNAIKVWTKADKLMGGFIREGDKLYQLISTKKATSLDIDKQLAHLEELNRKLTVVEDQFSFTLGQASRWLENLIFKILIGIAITVEFTGIFLTIMIGLNISRNIKAISKVAKKITKSDFSERVIVSSKDEVGQLAISFNVMIDELDKNIKRQRQLENKFKSILESAPDALVITNQDGEIMLINVQTKKIFGYSKSEITGKYIECLVPPRFRSAQNNISNTSFLNSFAESMKTGIELYGLRKNGDEFPVEISLSPVEIEEGTLTLYVIRDLTEKKNIELMLIDKNVQLENANVAKDQFLSHMSHELRTPLNGIITMTQLLITSDLTKNQKDQLDIISESEMQLLLIINQILDFSKIKSKMIEVEKVVFNLHELIRKTLAVYEIKSQIKNIPYLLV